MSQPSVLKCVLCGKEYEPSTAPYTCDQCGLDGTLDVLYDYPRLKKSLHRASLEADSTPSLWRYGPVLLNKQINNIEVNRSNANELRDERAMHGESCR